MRFKLLALLAVSATLPVLGQNAAIKGTVVDAETGSPVEGAMVMLEGQGVTAVTGPSGEFSITSLIPGSDGLTIAAFGYGDINAPVILSEGNTIDLGRLMVSERKSSANAINTMFNEDREDILFDESVLDDEESASQTINALTGANDNIYYNTSNYNFSVQRFRFRGYDSKYNTMYLNGIPVNDLARGRFNYSTFGGLNRAIRNRTNTVGMQAADYGFGGIGGSANINTINSEYAPGFYGSLAYTNANYMFRAMTLYSTGMTDRGWGATVGAVGRYANEGVVPGTFYNSGGIFLSVEKRFSPKNSLNMTAFCAPTQRAGNSATYEEAFELAGNNLYNPNWGYYQGKKRSSKIYESWDPTILFNWLYNPNKNTSLNMGGLVRWVNYSSSALDWTHAADPRPDYYRNLPFYYENNDDAEGAALARQNWKKESHRQINWNQMYQTNLLTKRANNDGTNPEPLGANYITKNYVSNQFNAIYNALVNHRFNNHVSLQGGASLNYTRAHYYQTVRDMLGGEFWLDVDKYSANQFPSNPDIAQNNLNQPNRKVVKGDIFGYNYTVNALQANVWLQNMITMPHWDVNYGLNASYTQYYRTGYMRNGRAPEDSYGKGVTHRFDNAGLKAGATYKINGRNHIMGHAEYETRAPLFGFAYLMPNIKDQTVDLQNERVFSADLSYGWNYRIFRGSIGAFYTDMSNGTEKSQFYDDRYSTFVHYMLQNVRTTYKGVELGMAVKIIPSLTATFAGTMASYRYKNNPTSYRASENGTIPDTVNTVYLKNYRVGGTPQRAAYIGLDYQAPKMWFFNLNAAWMSCDYVMLAPSRHEAQSELWSRFPDAAKREEVLHGIADQQKLDDAWVLNLSIGKVWYVNRKLQLNFNLNVDNILNNRNIQNYGYQQSRIDTKTYNPNYYPNRYLYAQGIKVMFNVGVRF